jgi:Amt family ammonium transporter
MVIWFTFSYLPMAHMVWYWDGSRCLHRCRRRRRDAGNRRLPLPEGRARLRRRHRGAHQRGVAGLVGAYMVGKRIGYGREAMPPHSLVHTMVGASLLWVGWFGFNAGSALEAATARCSPSSTPGRTSAATIAWSFAEWALKGNPSMLGARLRRGRGPGRDHPACRQRRHVMGALVIGLVAGVVCLWGVNGLKKLLGADDSLDVFGVHGVGGILGALLTGVFAYPSLGGSGVYDYVANAVGPYDLDRPGDQSGLGRGRGHRLVGPGRPRRLQASSIS